MAKDPKKKLTKAQQAEFDLLLKRGDELYEAKNYQSALELFDELINKFPNESKAWSGRAAPRTNLNKLFEAIEDCNHAINLDPSNEEAWYNKATALMTIGDYSSALQDCNEAIEIMPENDKSWFLRGSIFSKLNQYEDALADYNKAIDIDPSKDIYFANRGAGKNKLGDFRGALDDIEIALKLNPNEASIWNNSGFAKTKLGQYEDAILDYETAININPQEASIWDNRGQAYSQLGNYEQAIKDIEKAIELNPSEIMFRNNLSSLMALKEAKAEVERQIKFVKEDFEKRFIRLDNSETDIVKIRKELGEKYDQYIKQRNVLSWLLFVIAALVTSSPVVIFILIVCGVDICNPKFCFTDIELDWTFLTYWSFISITLTAPILIKLKLISRDTEEAKVLNHDYSRMQMIEAKFNLFQPFLSDEKRQELFEKQLENWMHNSPTATLMKLKKRHADKSASHPIEEIIERCLEKCKAVVKKEDNTP